MNGIKKRSTGIFLNKVQLFPKIIPRFDGFIFCKNQQLKKPTWF